MDHHEESARDRVSVHEVEPYTPLKQILEEEAARQTAQESVVAQERTRRHSTTEQDAPLHTRDTVRYGLD